MTITAHRQTPTMSTEAALEQALDVTLQCGIDDLKSLRRDNHALFFDATRRLGELRAAVGNKSHAVRSAIDVSDEEPESTPNARGKRAKIAATPAKTPSTKSSPAVKTAATPAKTSPTKSSSAATPKTTTLKKSAAKAKTPVAKSVARARETEREKVTQKTKPRRRRRSDSVSDFDDSDIDEGVRKRRARLPGFR